jgi:beta-lactamase superfamily II metal-dependent hydrolase
MYTEHSLVIKHHFTSPLACLAVAEGADQLLGCNSIIKAVAEELTFLFNSSSSSLIADQATLMYLFFDSSNNVCVEEALVQQTVESSKNREAARARHHRLDVGEEMAFLVKEKHHTLICSHE